MELLFRHPRLQSWFSCMFIKLLIVLITCVVMGTKRAFDEELQELTKHPKPLESGDEPASFAENEVPLDTSQDVGIEGEDVRTVDDPESDNIVAVPDELTAGPWPVFSTCPFSEYYRHSLSRRQIFDDDDRQEIPVGPDHQADVPEFDSEVARNYNNNFDNGGMEKFLGVCVIPMPHLNSDYITEDDEASEIRKDCECWDRGSVRCVQQHVKEARLKLRESVGDEKFVALGMVDMGEEVARRWSQSEERLFHLIAVYMIGASHGNTSWRNFRFSFPSKTMKDLISYNYNVFMLQRRAAQNRKPSLEIDSDDDGWEERRGENSIAARFATSHGDHVSSDDDGVDTNSNDIDADGGEGEGEGDFVVGDTETLLSTSFEDQPPEPNPSSDHLVTINGNKVSSEG